MTLFISVIVLTLSLKMVRLCINGTVLFYCLCSSFLFHIQSFHEIQIKLCLSLSWGDASIALPETVKAISARTFCSRHNIAVETVLTCTKHCKGIVTDPLWQIFRLLCLFSLWDEKAAHSFYWGDQEVSSIPFKKIFCLFTVFGVFPQLYFSAVISSDIWSYLKFTHLIIFFRNCCISGSYSADRSQNYIDH